MVAAKKEETTETLTITAPNIRSAQFVLVGTSPLVINHFGTRKQGEVIASMTNPGKAKSKKSRPPKDLERDFQDARYIDATGGWDGLNASGIRNACISACRVAGYQMTKAKLSIFVDADGFDKDHFTPLLRIHGEEPRTFVTNVRNESGVIDIRARPMWIKWTIKPVIRYDADQFKLADVANLLHRAGLQVGLGEGRHDSRKSAGVGFGCFRIESTPEEA